MIFQKSTNLRHKKAHDKSLFYKKSDLPGLKSSVCLIQAVIENGYEALQILCVLTEKLSPFIFHS